MQAQPPYVLTSRDYSILRGIAVHRPQGQRGYFDLLREKLLTAETVEDDEIDPQIVTLNSVVRYRIGDGKALEHKLVIGPAREVFGQTVSVRSIYGLALIGTRPEQIVPLTQDGMAPDRITVDMVLFQPESAS